MFGPPKNYLPIKIQTVKKSIQIRPARPRSNHRQTRKNSNPKMTEKSSGDGDDGAAPAYSSHLSPIPTNFLRKKESRPQQSLQGLHQEFMDETQYCGKKTKNTLRGYKQVFSVLTKVMPIIDLQTLTPSTMVAFFRALDTRERQVGNGIKTKQGVKKSTIASYRFKLMPFFDWLVKKNLITTNPFADIPSPAIDYGEIRFLRNKEVNDIFVTLLVNIKWTSLFLQKRNAAMFAVLLCCGLRRNELLGLTVFDVDTERKELTVRGVTSKTKRTRMIPLNSFVFAKLMDYLLQRRDRGYLSEFLFCSDREDAGLSNDGLKHLVEQITNASGVNFRIQDFRHTFAVNHVNAGTDVTVLQKLLGHTDIASTLIYLRYGLTRQIRDSAENIIPGQLI